MKIQFVTPATRKPRLLSDVELHFEGSEPLAGLKLVGFGIWRKPRGKTDEVYVTLPGRAYGGGDYGPRGYFDYLRSNREEYPDTDAIRTDIIDAWMKLQ